MSQNVSRARRHSGLIREWVDNHVPELEEDWKLAREGKEIKKIDPLDYTSYRHEVAFLEYLKFQREQGIKLLFVRCVRLI